MVPKTPRKRRVSVAAIGFLALLDLSDCSAAANVAATPTTVDEGRGIAEAIAAKAGCGSFEDYNLNGHPGRWSFTCQMNDASFEIIVYGSLNARTEHETQLSDAGWQYWSQDSYTIVSAFKPTTPATSRSLEPFKEALDHSKTQSG